MKGPHKFTDRNLNWFSRLSLILALSPGLLVLYLFRNRWWLRSLRSGCHLFNLEWVQTEHIHYKCLLKPFPGQYSLLQCPLFFPQEDKQPAQGTHMPRTGCVILLSQFTKQKHSVSLHLIRKLARRPGWSGFSYAGVRHMLSFSSSWSPWQTERGKTALEPSLAWTLPSVEQGTGTLGQTPALPSPS